MNEFETFESGVSDAEFDLNEGWVPKNVTVDYITAEFRGRLDCSDEYLAGYFSVIFR